MKKLHRLLSLAALLGGTGCQKLVDVPGNAGPQLVTSQVFTDSANATAGVLGLYQGSAALTSGLVPYYTALSGDEGELNYPTIFPADQRFYTETVLPGSATVAGDAALLWSGPYGALGIFGANAAIENIGADADSSLSASARNQLIGECKVLRAYQYFSLVNLFGAVPLVLSTDWQTSSRLPRATSDVVYRQIIQDLQDARGLLTPAYPSAGHQRPNKYVAMALLARVYLYDQQWDQAKAMADSVILSGGYSLVTNLDNIFLDQSAEAIWQVSTTDPSAAKAAPGTDAIVGTFSAPEIYLNPLLMNAFETGDQRKGHWTKPFTTIDFTTYTIYTVQAQNKYRNMGSTVNSSGKAAEDLMIIRLAEIYLIRAEALARQGDLAGAMQDLNIIRNRAGLGPVTAPDLATALGLILQERYVELFMEWGHRWFDLKRMDSVNSVMMRLKPQYWPADGHAALYPVSAVELVSDVNLTQNPGY